ncbi:hypothetical protein [Ralstonia solanacearum]|nr:hypothetical protein [Ralstonia solanacearum]MDB0507794.1 hypothetical protein [Ralstonia solanacearum]MDB0512064.1 hypothetical protein [Ralstonia solanacearum]MDB0566448.1 hypothetical protein [Ralstonia solanacearum]MDB0575869.1 hypothetical protein [Ralstonia solanacearum]QTY25571.1 hypothetical protein CDC46_29645 [Ralstonia solanacearum]
MLFSMPWRADTVRDAAHLGVLADRLDARVPASFWPAFARLRDECARRIPRP